MFELPLKDFVTALKFAMHFVDKKDISYIHNSVCFHFSKEDSVQFLDIVGSRRSVLGKVTLIPYVEAEKPIECCHYFDVRDIEIFIKETSELVKNKESKVLINLRPNSITHEKGIGIQAHDEQLYLGYVWYNIHTYTNLKPRWVELCKPMELEEITSTGLELDTMLKACRASSLLKPHQKFKNISMTFQKEAPIRWEIPCVNNLGLPFFESIRTPSLIMFNPPKRL